MGRSTHRLSWGTVAHNSDNHQVAQDASSLMKPVLMDDTLSAKMIRITSVFTYLMPLGLGSRTS